MTDFSQLLNKFIEQKKIGIYSMAKYCGLDRSTLYKIINGKRRPPVPAVRDKMARFMRLTPNEILQFEQAWTLSTVGKLNYCRRKSMENFLLNFSNMVSAVSGQKISAPEKLPESFSCILFLGESNFYSYVQYILNKEQESENGRIGILMQPGCKLFMHCLTPSVLNQSGCSARIDHLFCLEQTGQLSESEEFCSFDYFGNILLPFKNRLNYHPYCFYDSISAHFSNLNLFSGFILTREYVIFCTHDCAAGILCHEPDVVEMMWKLFSDYQSSCFPVLKTVEKLPVHFRANPIIDKLTKGALQSYAENDILYLTFKDMQEKPVCLSLHTPMLIYAFLDFIKNYE